MFENELALAGAPWLIPFGVVYVGPAIYAFGDGDQKQKYLEPILNSDVWWAQGFSEPNAGSDLASLTTHARRDGDFYILNGQKTWTTMAQWADYIFVLARTDRAAKSQQGISFFLVDMRSSGVSVRPIATTDGAAHLNDIFFEDVRVPASGLMGVEGEGWKYAKHLLSEERLLVAEIGKARRLQGELRAILGELSACGAIADNVLWRDRMLQLEIETYGLEALVFEMLGEAERGSDPGPLASVLKIMGSELLQSIESAAVDLFTHLGLVYGEMDGAANASALEKCQGGYLYQYLYGRASTIYGGSNEIQRNIIAKSVLGL